MKSQRGSALVLTLLFIMLLTTMSTALYLYASKQSMFADSNYTTIAAGYVADAGLEMGKGLLVDNDIRLNTFGQNPADGIVDRDDFPVILPLSNDIGRYDTNASGDRVTDNKQGVGKYALRIDAAYSEIVDFDFSLIRNIGINPSSDLVFGDPTRCNRLLPGKKLKLIVRQGVEVVNQFEYDYRHDTIYTDQISGTMEYNPINISNIINPFVGDDVTIELNRTDISSNDHDLSDAFGNVLCPLHQVVTGNLTGGSALEFEIIPKSCSTYLLKIENSDAVNQDDIVVEIFYHTTLAGNTSRIICAQPQWAHDDVVYALLDFSVDSGMCKGWTTNMVHPGSNHGSTHSYAVEVYSPNNKWMPSNNVTISLMRGHPGDVVAGLKMRCESMPGSCWWPAYPHCSHHTTAPYQDIITLSETDDSAEYLLTPDMMRLGFYSKVRVDELYTITSTGNVEDATEARELMVSPVSFMDYARFTQSRLTLAPGAMFGGRVYCKERIELPSSGDVYFFDDVLTSSVVVNPTSAKFPRNNGVLVENFPEIEVPDLQDIATFYANNRGSAWVIGTALNPKTYDIFLGNYDYLQTEREDTYWGLDFSSTPPVYYAPTATILDSESWNPRNGWSPGALPPGTTTLPVDFNGLIYVNGNVRIWGTLHGRSVTVFARGDIVVEREIIMGTDELDTTGSLPGMSTKEGMPVHMNLVPLKNNHGTWEGDIVLGEYCPRIMRIESGLMAFAGALTTEDVDWMPSHLDADRSHGYNRWRWMGNYYKWEYVNEWLVPYDLNNDGRLTDARDFTVEQMPRIELGDWNEKDITSNDNVWYLQVVGPFVDRDGAAAGHFAVRATMTGPGRNGTTRNYRYDPSYRINSPPFVAQPENSLRLLPWDPYVYELPN